MDRLFDEIENIRHGFIGHNLNDEDVATFQKELAECGLNILPSEVIVFLQKYNGFLLENRCVWGINNKEHYRYDIIGENALAQNVKTKDILLLGSTETTYIGWMKEKNNYAVLDKYDFEPIFELDNFADAVRYILKIDD